MTSTEQFLRQFNQHWVRADVGAILDDVTDEIRFVMVGKPPIKGKADFKKMLDEMPADAGQMSLAIDHIIVDGDRAMLNGLIRMPGDEGGQKSYAFCDVYRLAGGKVAELTAYVVEVDADEG